MNEVFKHRFHFKKKGETEINSRFTEEILLQVRFTELVTMATDSEYKLPLFQKQA